MKRKKLRGLLIAVLILIIIGGGAFAFFKFRSGTGAGQVTNYTVKSETFTNVIEIAGTISAAKEQNLQAPGDGTVTAVYVSEGDTVQKDQVVLQMDDTEQRYNLAKHDYDVEIARVNDKPPREIQLMANQRRVLLQKLKDRQIIANFDGLIVEFTASAGDVFEAKDTAGVIIDRSYLVAYVEVVETDAPKLREGQKVSMKFPAQAQEIIEGIVHSFPAMATKSSRGASVVKAEIRINDPPDIILPNYSFTGEIEISPPETFLLVEREAIGYERPANEGGERQRGTAFAEKIGADGTLTRVNVRVEPYGTEFVKVLSGLAEGDVVAQQEKPRASGWNSRQLPTGQTPASGSQNNQRRQTNTPAMPMMPR